MYLLYNTSQIDRAKIYFRVIINHDNFELILKRTTFVLFYTLIGIEDQQSYETSGRKPSCTKYSKAQPCFSLIGVEISIGYRGKRMAPVPTRDQKSPSNTSTFIPNSRTRVNGRIKYDYCGEFIPATGSGAHSHHKLRQPIKAGSCSSRIIRQEM